MVDHFELGTNICARRGSRQHRWTFLYFEILTLIRLSDINVSKGNIQCSLVPLNGSCDRNLVESVNFDSF